MARETAQDYCGFEQGPIRPPSEAFSLLIRVTRNCPWNRCSFCPVYKGQKFSLRHVDNVKRDIDDVHRHVEILRKLAAGSGSLTQAQVHAAAAGLGPEDMQVFATAVHWFAAGMQSVFLQDADSLIIKPDDLVEILRHLRAAFPWVDRVTSYARSHTLARIQPHDMKRIADVGLNRIHVGMESGSDEVLKMSKKGTTKEQHIKAGIKVKNAGIELSEYVMPGLGGVRLSRDHACETADALNQIDPDFIRLRTLRILDGLPLHDQWQSGRFDKCTEAQVVEEIMLFLEKLEGISGVIKSDHMNNLLQDVEGRLPEDKPRMLNSLRSFLSLDANQQSLYVLGRGMGCFRGVSDMDDRGTLQAVQNAYDRLQATPETVERIIVQLRGGRM